MRFLIDAQLSRRLAAWLSGNGHDARHTLDLPNRNRSTDAEICVIAAREKRIVVTKDDDFVRSYLLNGQPPQLLLIATGNINNDELLELFQANLAAIAAAFDSASFVEIGRNTLIVHE